MNSKEILLQRKNSQMYVIPNGQFSFTYVMKFLIIDLETINFHKIYQASLVPVLSDCAPDYEKDVVQERGSFDTNIFSQILHMKPI